MTNLAAHFKSKLKSQRGASITYALLVMLVGVMISTVVITVSYSNAGTAKTSQRSEQNYLTVSSAAEMFRNALSNDSVTYENTVSEKYVNNISKGTIEGDYTNFTYVEATVGKDDPIADLVKEWVVNAASSTLTQSKDFTVKVNTGTEDLSDVNVHMEMTDYNITMVFSLADTSDGNYMMSVVFRNTGLVKTTDPTSRGTTSYGGGQQTRTDTTVNHYKVQWTDANISVQKGDATQGVS